MCDDLNPEDERFSQGWPSMPTPQNPGPRARAAGCAECLPGDLCALHRLFQLIQGRESRRHPEEAALSERLKAQKAASDTARADSRLAAGCKNDAGKPRWDLMSFPFLDQVAQVLAAGAAEYGAENWRKVPDAGARYRAALFRHLSKFMCGEKRDPKSGLPHLAHAACNMMFLFEFEKNTAGLSIKGSDT